jgi:ParB family chromosome partitioning protein
MTESITLKKLLVWTGNVRKTYPQRAVDELAASIAAHGLLQSLVVRKDKRGRYAVVAGGLRLRALSKLAEEGTVPWNMPIPCTVLTDEADATEISLAENVVREPMHPADEFDAFKEMIEGGKPIMDIAARFGVTETVVQQRLRLARVSPALISAYRNDEMTLQHLMAFTVSNDHAAQERLWNELSDWQKRDPRLIREALAENEITAQDRRVHFVTLKAYEKAGGRVRRDLFSERDLVARPIIVNRRPRRVARGNRRCIFERSAVR